jgi:glutamyl-tRNA synthetase
MVRVRFAPSPTGSLHLGSALTAVANRRFADERDGELVLRIDDTNVEDASEPEAAILEDLAWLGIAVDTGPIRQSGRLERHREAAREIGNEDDAGAIRFGRTTLLRPDGRPTYHLASVVDDVDFGITHVYRGNDHRPNEELHRRLHEALGTIPPEYVHHGLILGEDGKKLSKRAAGATVESLRELGIPAEAVRGYLEELGIPRHDVHYDLARIRRLAVDAIEAMSDEELAGRAEIPLSAVPVARGARDLSEARNYAAQVLEAPPPRATEAPETLERFRELAGGEPRAIVRELKAVGGDLRALRLALTGRDRGPELTAILAALSKEEALRRVDQALQHTQP